MSEDIPNDRLICRKQRGHFYVPGGVIYMDDLVYCSHAILSQDQPDIYLGWLTIETQRHAPGLVDLTNAEGKAVVLWIDEWPEARRRAAGEHAVRPAAGFFAPGAS